MSYLSDRTETCGTCYGTYHLKNLIFDTQNCPFCLGKEWYVEESDEHMSKEEWRQRNWKQCPVCEEVLIDTKSGMCEKCYQEEQLEQNMELCSMCKQDLSCTQFGTCMPCMSYI